VLFAEVSLFYMHFFFFFILSFLYSRSFLSILRFSEGGASKRQELNRLGREELCLCQIWEKFVFIEHPSIKTFSSRAQKQNQDFVKDNIMASLRLGFEDSSKFVILCSLLRGGEHTIFKLIKKSHRLALKYIEQWFSSRGRGPLWGLFKLQDGLK